AVLICTFVVSPFTLYLFLSLSRRPPRPPLFPYTTLFRSEPSRQVALAIGDVPEQRRGLAQGACDRPAEDDAQNQRQPHRAPPGRSEEHTSELQSRFDLVCRLLLEKKKKNKQSNIAHRTQA